MIVLHRLGRGHQPLYLNRDLIMTVEANPDTVITLTSGEKIVVGEPPEVVAARVREARAEVVTLAIRRRRERPIHAVETNPEGRPDPILTPVQGSAAERSG